MDVHSEAITVVMGPLEMKGPWKHMEEAAKVVGMATTVLSEDNVETGTSQDWRTSKQEIETSQDSNQWCQKSNRPPKQRPA